jgi:hypothetical protein
LQLQDKLAATSATSVLAGLVPGTSNVFRRILGMDEAVSMDTMQNQLHFESWIDCRPYLRLNSLSGQDEQGDGQGARP